MAQPLRDSFLDLEKHRQLLETNIEKLRKSLEHWQLWEAEYEGLKEEILAVKPEPTFQRLITIGREYGGVFLKQDEVDDVLGVKSGKLRSASQVTDLLSKRIDYVQQNVKTLETQLQAAENKLLAATVVSTPDAMNEDGLPLTEIFEELDDDGNVVSSRISTPGSSKAQLLEVLEKAGVKSLTDDGLAAPKESSSNHVADEMTQPMVQEMAEKTETKTPTQKTTKKGVTFAEDIKVATFKRDSRPNLRDDGSPAIRKVVTFAQDKVKGELEDVPEPNYSSENLPSNRDKYAKDIIELVKEQNDPLPADAVVPENESAEDAALRQEMLKYGMSDLGEVGAIVAELSLEENDSGGFTDDDDYDDDDYDDSSMEDEEDDYGRSTRKIVTEKMHQEMRELEQRLKARMMENVGPNGNMDEIPEGVRQVTIKPDVEKDSGNKTSPTPGVKKGVRFAEKLEISPAPKSSPSQDSQPGSKTDTPAKALIGDIVERAPVPAREPKKSEPAKKPSRFKSARAADPSTGTSTFNQASMVPIVRPSAQNPPQPPQSLPLKPVKTLSPFSAPIPVDFSLQSRTRTVPTGPKNSTIGDIIEHEPSTDPNHSVSEPDELDPDLLNQEVATEYHRMRNRMIQRQGGFMKEEEPEVDEDGFVKIPMTEEEGGAKKVSRFKAAQLSKT